MPRSQQGDESLFVVFFDHEFEIQFGARVILSQMTAMNAKLKTIPQIVLVAAGAKSAEAATKVAIAKAARFCRRLAPSLADSAGSIDESPKLALHATSLREAARTRLNRCVGVVSARPPEEAPIPP